MIDPERPVPDARPLAGRTILVTRPEAGASRMGELLEDLGACVRLAPMIRITAPADWASVDASIRALDLYQWIIFTSANGAKYLAKRLSDLGVAPETISRESLILAIGPATAVAVEAHLGRIPDRLAGKYAAEGVIELFEGEKVAGKRILLSRAKEGRDAIPKALAGMGATVDDVAVYRTTPLGREALRDVWGELETGKMDMLAFTSSSAFDGFMKAAGEETAKKWMTRARVASIGPATTAAVRKWGFVPDVEAAESTILGMVRAIASYYRKPERGGSASRMGRRTR